jgi:glycosyltransferase involved in cell wall biosynthesis
VESAFSQKETGEVILVEDCSPDNSLEECRKLADKYEKVKLYRHPDKGNHGAGATRNLGIKKAKCDYIAFLDADDYYLPNRFKSAKKIFSQNDTVEGVYEAIGTKFESEEVKKKWLDSGCPLITTVKKSITPDRIFEELIMGNIGHFHGNGLVVKKDIFRKTRLFNEKLRISQDTHMWLKMVAVGKLVPGDIENPVAVRRVHGKNRITQVNSKELKNIKISIWNNILQWGKRENISSNKLTLLEYNIFYHKNLPKKTGLKLKIYRIYSIIKFSYYYPSIKNIEIIKICIKRYLNSKNIKLYRFRR